MRIAALPTPARCGRCDGDGKLRVSPDADAMTHPKWPPRGLYAITDGPRDDLIEVCALALEGGATMLQYRDKTAEHARRHLEATALAQLCRCRGVPLIVNDDIELAAAVGADGVHLGEYDEAIGAARARLGTDAIIGVSCYDSIERARALAANRPDYLAFGAFFASPTKPLARRAALHTLHDARAFGLPLVAIGGITLDSARSVIDAGADAIAVISAVFGARDVRAAAAQFARLFERPGS